MRRQAPPRAAALLLAAMALLAGTAQAFEFDMVRRRPPLAAACGWRWGWGLRLLCGSAAPDWWQLPVALLDAFTAVWVVGPAGWRAYPPLAAAAAAR